ncbi:hypothetical protein B0T16DRAFT_404556 [Cercophora newfieldiana]|uniref:Uncharacterized protein n=1 Tax=Cercophora newfieldiana TaxID=92897 RepID=A0AA39YFK9_9PEZI|nr:hypothetical protein B0T16DRAFT_404556 [Cercophora newfieldiana]
MTAPGKTASTPFPSRMQHTRRSLEATGPGKRMQAGARWRFSHRAEPSERRGVNPGSVSLSPLSWSRHWSHRPRAANICRRVPALDFVEEDTATSFSGLQHRAGLPHPPTLLGDSFLLPVSSPFGWSGRIIDMRDIHGCGTLLGTSIVESCSVSSTTGGSVIHGPLDDPAPSQIGSPALPTWDDSKTSLARSNLFRTSFSSSPHWP